MKIKILELFAGYGSQAMALKRLGFEVESEISEIDKYAIQAYNQIHGETKNWGDITKINECELPTDYDIISYSSPCFVGDTLVLTKCGYKEIKNITIDDYVLTHNNTYEKVVNIKNQGIKSIINLRTMGADLIRCTPEHKFYARKKSHIWVDKGRKSKEGWKKKDKERIFLEPEWIEAQNLSKDYYLGVALNNNAIIPEWNGYEHIKTDGRYYHYDDLKKFMNNHNFWWLIGRFLGDGWCRSDDSGIIICCTPKETTDILSHLRALEFNYCLISERTVCKIHIPKKELALFCRQFGSGALNKFLPGFIFDMPDDLLKDLIEGYLSADGSYIKEEKQFKFTTISKLLAYGFAHIISKAYKRPYSISFSERPKTAVIEGRIVNQHDTYCVCFHMNKKKQDMAFYENGYLWLPITFIKNNDESEMVYDIEVENAHSFTANNIIVHNCQDWSFAGLQMGGAEGSGTRSSLLWECQRIITHCKPKYLMLENVKALVSKKFKPYFDEWLRRLEDMGYNNYWQVMNAKDYGVPQNRERVFCISVRKDVDDGTFKFPEKEPLTKRLRDILEPTVDEKFYLKGERVNKLINDLKERIDSQDSAYCIGTNYNTTTKDFLEKHRRQLVYDKCCVASRGRNPENPSDRTTGSPTEQRLEINDTGCSNTLTSVQKDNYVLETANIEVLGNYKPSGHECGRVLNTEGISSTIKENHGAVCAIAENYDTVAIQQVGNIAEEKNFSNPQTGRVYSSEGLSPTINTMQGGQREPKIVDDIRIRKLTPHECFRLMDVSDEDFAKLNGISNSQLYKLAGNSIVVTCMEKMFKNLFKVN